MIKIPEAFQERMKSMLKDEFTDFIQSYETTAYQGLRVNSLKIDVPTFLSLSPFSLKPIPWCPTGFYYSKEDRPGKHPYHAAGLYYIQEPSAMSVVEVLEPQPGESILDLCAAPGGKSTQIASKMKGQGFLVSNEFNQARSKALSENIERCGIPHALVTNETPERLAQRFPVFFDRILVDAPCSGEGMFRKLEEACEDWTNDKVALCSRMQREILSYAASMLKPGGTLVYSTCTFSAEENEIQIAQFLSEYPEFKLETIQLKQEFSAGRPEWANDVQEVTKTARLWPHLLKGEGHFIAKLSKLSTEDELPKSIGKNRRPPVDKQALLLFENFRKEFTTLPPYPEQQMLLFGEQLYLTPKDMPSIDKLKVLRPGLHLGTVKKGRFEPSHALALALSKEHSRHSVSLASDQPEVYRYLKGECLLNEGAAKGWTLVCVDQFPLGWGKVSNGQLKNHYPKGLRG